MRKTLKRFSCGRRGPDVRSDCFVEIEIRRSGGIDLKLTSKVESMYGASIRRLIARMLKFYSIPHARVRLEDAGALSWVIAARCEAAVRRLFPDADKEFRLQGKKAERAASWKQRLRRTRLYLPGNEPKFMVNAPLHRPDGIILDLEDSVPPAEKDAARILVRNALRHLDFSICEVGVRINQLPLGFADLRAVIPAGVGVVYLPKTESVDMVRSVEDEIQRIERENGRPKRTLMIPILESAVGILNAYSIAISSDRICALAIGLEDYTADIGIERTAEGKESLFARMMLVTAAKAAAIQALDSVYSDVDDLDHLRLSTLEAKSLGFDGRGCIHPRQIEVVHSAFAPTEAEVLRAKAIVRAANEARRVGSGVVTLGSKMIDAPVVLRARRTIQMARMAAKNGGGK